MKITDKTTLGELMLERARLGITELIIRIHTNNRVCIALTESGGAQRSGATEAEAISKVFEAIERESFVPPFPKTLDDLPLPPGCYEVKLDGDMFNATATITEGEHAGKTFLVPAPKLDLDYHEAPATSEKAPIIPRGVK